MLKRWIWVFFLSALPLVAAQKGVEPPFLITGGMPHFVKHIKALWEDPGLELDAKQKKGLLAIRKKTMAQVRHIAAELEPLQADVARSAMAGAVPDTQRSALETIARLKTEATLVHLHCIYETRAILTQAQYDYLLAHIP